jgi:hypothetical protein
MLLSEAGHGLIMIMPNAPCGERIGSDLRYRKKESRYRTPILA